MYEIYSHRRYIHWGMIPDSDKPPGGKKREQAIRLTFQGIIEDARGFPRGPSSDLR
ncbi:MAG: hypothetical protein ACLR78_05340 [Roseburia sp.]